MLWKMADIEQICSISGIIMLLVMPQGSILGPLLFILFIDNIYEQLDPETRISLYADDTKIWKLITSKRDCEKLQLDIDRLHD